MTNTVSGVHLGIDTHANRPAASAVTAGTLYSCSDHDLIYRSDESSWSTWATLGGGGGGSGALTLIDSHEVTGSAESTITFSSIPATHKHLMLVVAARDDSTVGAFSSVGMQVGATTVDSGANYYYAAVRHGDGGQTITEGSGESTIFIADNCIPRSNTADKWGSIEAKILNYASTTIPRVIMANAGGRSDAGKFRASQVHGHWEDTTDAIDIITIQPTGADSNDFAVGTIAHLYGIG